MLVVASLLSAAFAAFQVKFNIQLWILVITGVVIAVSGYVVFEITLAFMAASVESTRQREEEWLKRVGKPARLELGMGGTAGIGGAALLVDAAKTMKPGSDVTIMLYLGPEGGRERAVTDDARKLAFDAWMEQLQRGTIREYKRVICFDHERLAKDHQLKSGILTVGEGPGMLDRLLGEHCRQMLETKGCSVFVAPAVVRQFVGLIGTEKACTSLEMFEQDTGARKVQGMMFFYDPPNGEIIEQFRQIERATERRMVAVHKIVFPEDVAATAERATR